MPKCNNFSINNEDNTFYCLIRHEQIDPEYIISINEQDQNYMICNYCFDNNFGSISYYRPGHPVLTFKYNQEFYFKDRYSPLNENPIENELTKLEQEQITMIYKSRTYHQINSQRGYYEVNPPS